MAMSYALVIFDMTIRTFHYLQRCDHQDKKMISIKLVLLESCSEYEILVILKAKVGVLGLSLLFTASHLLSFRDTMRFITAVRYPTLFSTTDNEKCLLYTYNIIKLMNDLYSTIENSVQ